MAKEQRDTEKVLLKERKSLIDNGATRRDVKIMGNRLYVGSRLRGTANTHSFSKCPTLEDSAPLVNKLIPTQDTSTVLFEQTDENQASSQPTLNILITIVNPPDNSFPKAWLLPQCTSIAVGYWNSRSLGNKLAFFQSLIYCTDPDIFLVAETWLNTSIFDNEILPNGSSFYRLDRKSRGGSVAIVTKATLCTSLINRPQTLKPSLHIYILMFWLHVFILLQTAVILISPTPLHVTIYTKLQPPQHITIL